MVSWLSVFRRVLEASELPGSLKAMCPSGPMPTRLSPPPGPTPTSDEKVNTARFHYGLFIRSALFEEVRCVPVQNVHIFWLDINVTEEIGEHE